MISENSKAELIEINQFEGFGKWDIIVPIYENNNKITKLLLYNYDGNAHICLLYGNNLLYLYFYFFH